MALVPFFFNFGTIYSDFAVSPCGPGIWVGPGLETWYENHKYKRKYKNYSERILSCSNLEKTLSLNNKKKKSTSRISEDPQKCIRNKRTWTLRRHLNLKIIGKQIGINENIFAEEDNHRFKFK